MTEDEEIDELKVELLYVREQLRELREEVKADKEEQKSEQEKKKRGVSMTLTEFKRRLRL